MEMQTNTMYGKYRSTLPLLPLVFLTPATGVTKEGKISMLALRQL